MAFVKLLRLLALSSLATMGCSFGAISANAVSINHAGSLAHRGHYSVQRKRRSTESCKARPSASTPAAVPTTHKSSTSVAKAAATPPPAAPASGKKVGIAWSDADDDDLKFFDSSHVGMCYTWSPFPPSNAKSLGMPFCPMLWGSKQTDDFKRLVVKGYANCAMGFNEPNQEGQSDMSPADGVQLWKEFIQPLASQGYTLVSPAVTNAPSGMTWMKSFFAACNDCTVDVVALHYYGTDASAMIQYLKDFHTAFGRDIWVTEFACQDFSGGNQPSASAVVEFYKEVIAFMENTSYIHLYFAFGVMQNMGNVAVTNQMMGPDGKPNTLGQKYLGNTPF